LTGFVFNKYPQAKRVRAGLDELFDLPETHSGGELFGFKADGLCVRCSGAQGTVDCLLGEQA
jgi:hypothetical protein